ncbi:MAG: type II secretion system protein [Sedimentisphaerales bacterium]|nr:type II secretion system protein [Sedimentisphaerales bacterium]
MKNRAFSLIELIIVVTILGVLSALVIPSFQGHIAKAKEASAKDNLQVVRNQIELYKIQHNGVPPGYINGAGAAEALMQLQFTRTTTETGGVSSTTIPDAAHPNGPYLKKLPLNPFNKLSNIIYVDYNIEFSAVADGESSGWLYKKETAEFKINMDGTDSEGISYLDY